MAMQGSARGTSVKNVPKQHTLSLALCGLGFWEIGGGLSKSFVVKRSMTFSVFDVFYFGRGGPRFGGRSIFELDFCKRLIFDVFVNLWLLLMIFIVFTFLRRAVGLDFCLLDDFSRWGSPLKVR